MALHLAELNWIPDWVLCSDSARTLETWDLVSSAWGDSSSAPHFELRPDLYLASPRGIIGAIRSCPPEATTLMVVAHNPGMHDVAQMLSRAEDTPRHRRLARKFPTGAVAVIECDIDSWASLDQRDNRLVRFIRPKDLR